MRHHVQSNHHYYEKRLCITHYAAFFAWNVNGIFYPNLMICTYGVARKL